VGGGGGGGAKAGGAKKSELDELMALNEQLKQVSGWGEWGTGVRVSVAHFGGGLLWQTEAAKRKDGDQGEVSGPRWQSGEVFRLQTL
jgi:hypothetical protein